MVVREVWEFYIGIFLKEVIRLDEINNKNKRHILNCPECQENMTVLGCRFDRRLTSDLRNHFHLHFRCLHPKCEYEMKVVLSTDVVESILCGVFDQFNEKNTANSINLNNLLLGIQLSLEPTTCCDNIFDIH